MTIDRRHALAMLGAGSVAASDRAQSATEVSRSGASDILNLRDFLTAEMEADVAAGTLRVDCSTAFQTAIDAASGKGLSSFQTGRRLRIPSGRYRLDRGLRLTWRHAEGVLDDGDMRRPSIEGDGRANTVLFFANPETTPALDVRGNSAGRLEGTHVRLVLRGFRMARLSGRELQGTGLRFRDAAFVTIDDLEIAGFATGIDAIDTLRVFASNSAVVGCGTALRARAETYSAPNVYKFLHCSIGGNRNHGAVFTAATNIGFDSCTFEGNGVDDPAGTSLSLIGGPADGGAAAHIVNCFFEGNAGAADIMCAWDGSVSGTVKISASTFQTDAGRSPRSHIDLSAKQCRMLVHVDCCAFKVRGTSAASMTSPLTVRTETVAVTETANLYPGGRSSAIRSR